LTCPILQCNSPVLVEMVLLDLLVVLDGHCVGLSALISLCPSLVWSWRGAQSRWRMCAIALDRLRALDMVDVPRWLTCGLVFVRLSEGNLEVRQFRRAPSVCEPTFRRYVMPALAWLKLRLAYNTNNISGLPELTVVQTIRTSDVGRMRDTTR